ncbi:MAG: PIG-L family deacetylase [Trueperaceae bacterium]|nr:PIG-L family deacetylase [Trueperaceae bacterium]
MTDLMLIVPHPDDEVFSCGGLFTRMARAGKSVATLTLTRGGSGRTLDMCSRDELPAVREVELRGSLHTLGVGDVRILDYPDGKLKDVPRDDIRADVVRHIEEVRPRVIVTFPKNGANGHFDHITVNEVVHEALDRTEHRVDALYYFASERPYGGAARANFISPEEVARQHLPPTHYVEVGDALENKLRAMAHHETQARSVLNFTRRFTRKLMVETFHRAYPDYPADEGPVTVPWLS